MMATSGAIEWTDEAWRHVDGFAGYEISSAGRVRSSRVGTQRLLKPRRHPMGYLAVSLRRAGRSHEFLIHRLVADAFLGSGGPLWVNHINGDKTDNRASNLEWTTPASNAVHAYKTGLQPERRGSRNGHAKLTDAIVREMREQRSSGMLIREIAAYHGVGKTTVTNIINGSAWSHV